MATFVVIHGAGDVASNWDLVAAELRNDGHQVVAVDLPCEDDSAGWDEYADTVMSAVGDRTDIVVVAHSLGAFTGTLVCARLPARLLVLVAGMVPSPGETADEWWSNTGHERAARAHADEHDGSDTAFYMHDVEPELAAAALAKGRDQSATPMTEPWPLDSWPDVPTRYLLFRDDRLLPAEWNRQLVLERLGISPDEMAGGHCAFLSRPKELADRLTTMSVPATGG